MFEVYSQRVCAIRLGSGSLGFQGEEKWIGEV